MKFIERAGLRLLHRLDPERAHNLSLTALRAGLVPMRGGPVTGGRLALRLAGLALPNPVGLAAGYDKNAVALGPLCRAGFGFVEVGASTPRPQPGNPRPRVFRLPEAQAVINRFGFNNEGADVIADRLKAHRDRATGGAVPVGLNLGANKESADRAGDFSTVLARCGPYVDFATVNVSSPNTEKLRDLQGSAALKALLARVMETRASLPRAIPVFLKIAPDLGTDEIEQIADVAMAAGIDGIIATNTTTARMHITGAIAAEPGGLSGEPLFERSTRVLAELSRATDGRLPLIGVGGIGSADAAWEKIKAGASVVQLYTALVYRGLSLVGDIAQGIDTRLAEGGYADTTAAAGIGRNDWL